MELESVIKGVTVENEKSRQLETDKRRLEAIYEASPLPIALLDWPSGRFVDVNPAWCALFGFDREEAIGKTSIELGQMRDIPRRAKLIKELNRDGGLRDVELQMYTRDGQTKVVIANVELIAIDGQPIIAITASPIADDRERGLEAGMNDDVPKPIKAAELDRVIQKWLTRMKEHKAGA